MNGGELVDILFVILMAGLVSRTLHFRRNVAKREAIFAQYKRGTPQYEYWSNRFGDKSLLALYTLAATAVVQLVFDYYKYSFKHPSELILLIGNLAGIVGLFYGLYLLKNAVGLKRPKDTRPNDWSNLS